MEYIRNIHKYLYLFYEENLSFFVKSKVLLKQIINFIKSFVLLSKFIIFIISYVLLSKFIIFYKIIGFIKQMYDFPSPYRKTTFICFFRDFTPFIFY